MNDLQQELALLKNKYENKNTKHKTKINELSNEFQKHKEYTDKTINDKHD